MRADEYEKGWQSYYKLLFCLIVCKQNDGSLVKDCRLSTITPMLYCTNIAILRKQKMSNILFNRLCNTLAALVICLFTKHSESHSGTLLCIQELKLILATLINHLIQYLNLEQSFPFIQMRIVVQPLPYSDFTIYKSHIIKWKAHHIRIDMLILTSI